jgi:glycine cleavage system aminomethyltransferase T
MAYVSCCEHAAVGTNVEIEVRGRNISGEIVPLPFYQAARK